MSTGLPAVQSLLRAPGFAPVRLAIGRLLHWHYRLRHLKRAEEVVLERLDGFPLLVIPGVLNPKTMRTGAFFASELHGGRIGADTMVLDMGTGSGVCAIAAARLARRVVAVDINPAAVRCARINALINSLEDRIEVLHGDLFTPVRGQRFDLVLFNPPFIRGVPKDDADRAWRSIDVAERFAVELADHLTPTGAALVLLSSYGDGGDYLREFRRRNLQMTPVAERVFVNERLALIEVRPNSRSRNSEMRDD